jgi:hypothetical protein
MTPKRPPGTPPGVVKNPKGINQFTGTEQRGKALSFRLTIGLDTEFRRTIEQQEITVTEALTQAIELWLKNPHV